MGALRIVFVLLQALISSQVTLAADNLALR